MSTLATRASIRIEFSHTGISVGFPTNVWPTSTVAPEAPQKHLAMDVAYYPRRVWPSGVHDSGVHDRMTRQDDFTLTAEPGNRHRRRACVLFDVPGCNGGGCADSEVRAVFSGSAGVEDGRAASRKTGCRASAGRMFGRSEWPGWRTAYAALVLARENLDASRCVAALGAPARATSGVPHHAASNRPEDPPIQRRDRYGLASLAENRAGPSEILALDRAIATRRPFAGRQPATP